MISSLCLSMIFSENRFPPIGAWPEGMLFRIMLWLRLPLYRTSEKGRKDCPTMANMPAEDGEIQVNVQM